MSQASPGQKRGQNARSCKMAPKHWFYNQPIFWIQLALLIGASKLCSCKSMRPEGVADRLLGAEGARLLAGLAKLGALMRAVSIVLLFALADCSTDQQRTLTFGTVLGAVVGGLAGPATGNGDNIGEYASVGAAAGATILSSRPSELPTFFPPTATDRFSISLRLTGENVTLQRLADRLTHALQEAGYGGGRCSYYWLDDLHGPGFAIVTHIEHIQPDGKPELNQRWGFDLPRYRTLTMGSLLRALIHADPGRYRLIALVVSRQPLIENATPMTSDQVVILNKGPSWLGDSPWKTVLATADFHLIAYVYEFERKSRSDDPVLMASSDLTAEQHLQSTGLYDDLKKDLSK
jgi:hypothetical protein